MGRAAFEERVWQWKAEYGGFITQQMRQMGASCDWSRERFTLDSQLSGESACGGSGLIYKPAVKRTAQQRLQISQIGTSSNEVHGQLSGRLPLVVEHPEISSQGFVSFRTPFQAPLLPKPFSSIVYSNQAARFVIVPNLFIIL